MSFFAGLVGTEPVPAEGSDGLNGIAATYGGGGRASVWRSDSAAMVHVPRPVTPEDRLDRFPAAFAGGTSRLVFDGRLDNREDVIRALALDPARAVRLGDGALVMAALERWGIDACPRLIGAFAFAWWNESLRRLVMAADASGGRTIFAHSDGRRLRFASRPLAVLAFPGMARQVDETAMAHLLLARPIPAGATPFRGVFRLPPAGLLVWKDGHHSISRYWRPDPGRRIVYRDPRDYVQAAREMLDQVVAANLRAIDPVACQLSGGLDSSAVAATAARLSSPQALHTLTAQPDPTAPMPAERPRGFYDEGPLAAATAALYPNITAHYLPAGPITPGEEDATALFRQFGVPMRNFTNFGAWQPLYARAKALGASVILTGTAGNCTLSWKSQALLADLAASGRFVELARQLQGLRRHGHRPWPQIRQNLLPYIIPARARRQMQRLRGTADKWRRRALLTADLEALVEPVAVTDSVLISTDRADYDRRSRIAYLDRYFANCQWLAGHPYVTGCDPRDPLGDRRLVEFCLALPVTIWQTNGKPRSFAREVLKDRLPPRVVDNQKRGYQNGDWFHRLTQLRPAFMAELDRLEASAGVRRMVNLPRIRAVAENWPADADAAMARDAEMLDLFGRGIHYSRFIRWIEGSNA
ncbi:asparagine synthase-related protein [Tistrella mobilis]|uniref:asparagine synthetase B family protein n=1 Tax=Tistrella mobilis TaxID=171437 RepID=UPI003557270C